MHNPARTVHLDALPKHLWHATKNLTETVLAPLLLFYALLSTTGFTGGLLAALGWVVAAVVFRLVLRIPVPTVLWFTGGLLVIRTIVGLATGSSFFYFLEPSLQNFLIASLLLLSLPFERTFLARLADDFCVLPPTLMHNARVQRFFRRVSVLWAVVFVVKGATTLWALAEATIEGYLMMSTIGSFALIGVAAAGSLLWFRRELRWEGIQLRFRKQQPVAAAA